MNIFFVCICAISSIFAYKHYPTKIREMNVPGYEPFKYVLWLHPYQGNPDGQQHYFSKQAFDSFNILPKDSVVIDIGAHTGDTSVAYARALGDSCTILAFEPCDLIYRVLKQNAEFNSNIIPLNYAVTEQDGEYNFVYTDIGCCNGGLSTVLQNEGPYFGKKIPFKVKGVNLEKFLFDNYFQFIDKISFIKIDTEGYDRFILKSIRNLILKNKPIIQIEVYPTLTYEEKSEFFDEIISLNYDIYFGGLESFKLENKILDKNQFIKLGLCDCTLIQKTSD